MREQRRPEWSKNIADVEFVWPWLIEGKSIEEAAETVRKCSPDGKFSTGGVWVHLKAIVGVPVKKTLLSAPNIGTVERAVKILQESGLDDAALKAEIARLCEESRKEVIARNAAHEARTAMLLLPKIQTWLRLNQSGTILSAADLARLFLADRAWISSRQPRKKKAPRKHGPDRKPADQTTWFSIGRRVEEKIPIGSQRAARRAVTEETRHEYDTVVSYHRKYRNWLKRQS
jgi:hypothetical protein